MKIVLEPCPGTGMEVMLEDGSTVKAKKVTVIPYFVTAQGASEVLIGTGSSKHGKVVDRFMLATAGKTGKTTRREHNPKGVDPAIDKPAAKKAGSEPETEPTAEQANDDDTDEA